MDDATIRALLERRWSDIENQEQVHAFYHDDVVLEFPQSGERFCGLANVRAMRTAYPARVALAVRRIVGSGPLWVGECVLTYDGAQPTHGVAIYELRDGKIARETLYFGEPFAAPAWRAAWTEPIEA